jgi:hypothetical protein
MLRDKYFDYIEERLNFLAFRVESRGKLNLLNLNLHSENFYLHLFNLLFGLDLSNLNTQSSNYPSIDLIDDTNKIVIQVSATSSKKKINSSLDKDSISKYQGYNFKFISISKDASKLRIESYNNPYKLIFDPQTDIYDVSSILEYISTQKIGLINNIYNFIKDELGNDINIEKLDSNLTHIINILADDDLSIYDTKLNLNPFEIDRKIEINNLSITAPSIRDLSKYFNKLNSKYEEFDKQGKNKSLSVLHKLKNVYSEVVLKNVNNNSDQNFLTLLDRIKLEVIQSPNFNNMSIDLLELCVEIVAVDAFIRCKIFEDPNEYNYVNT